MTPLSISRSKTYLKSLEDKYAVAGALRNLAYFKGENYTQWRALQSVNYPSDYDFPENDIAVLVNCSKSYNYK